MLIKSVKLIDDIFNQLNRISVNSSHEYTVLGVIHDEGLIKYLRQDPKYFTSVRIEDANDTHFYNAEKLLMTLKMLKTSSVDYESENLWGIAVDSEVY